MHDIEASRFDKAIRVFLQAHRDTKPSSVRYAQLLSGRHIAHNAEAVRHFLGAGYCAEDCCGDAADECDAELPETLPRAAAAAGYASIQLLHHCDLGCIDEAQG